MLPISHLHDALAVDDGVIALTDLPEGIAGGFLAPIARYARKIWENIWIPLDGIYIYIWCIHTCMVYTVYIYIYMCVCVVYIYIYMVYPWYIYGISMVYPWYIYGNRVKFNSMAGLKICFFLAMFDTLWITWYIPQ